MTGFALSPTARAQVDAIYDYTVERWGDDQASDYVDGLFEEFGRITDRLVIWRTLPTVFGVVGFSCRWRSHVVYWTMFGDELRIVAVLHGHMDQVSRAREAFAAGKDTDD